jgi:NAD(P)H-nitrite reductase large subunit
VGLQVIQALSIKGMKVTGIVSSDRILSKTLDVEASHLIKTVVEQRGIRIYLEWKANEVAKGYGGTLWVVLDDGKKIRGDLLIIAKGVGPRIELLKQAKISFSRGASADDHLQTSRRNIYAAGDIKEFCDLIYENRKINATWPNAIDQGFVAGLNMSGSKTEYQGGLGMNVTELFGIKMASIGMIQADNESREFIFLDISKPVYKKVVLKHGRNQGAVFFGGIFRILDFFIKPLRQRALLLKTM